ncbi:MAG: response regulator [Spirochaetaceae bacterium]|jgi:signal transduction histidine kinase/CheY-like chemotaxis protein|nr:response regulator [Spirochaetaceae bacterium]
MINILFLPGFTALSVAAFAIYDSRRYPWNNMPLILAGIDSVIWTFSTWLCFMRYSPAISTAALYAAEASTMAFLPLMIWSIRRTYPESRLVRTGAGVIAVLFCVFLFPIVIGMLVTVHVGAGQAVITHKTHFVYYAYLLFNILCPVFALAGMIDCYISSKPHFRRDLQNIIFISPLLLVGSVLLGLRFPFPASRTAGCFFQTAGLLVFYVLVRRIQMQTLSETQAAAIVFSSVQTPFLFLDISGSIFYANDYALDYFGMDMQEIRGKTLGDLFHFDGGPPPPFSVRKGAAFSGGEFSAEAVRDNASCHLSVRCIWDSYDEFKSAIVEIDDISEQEVLIARLEREKKKAEAATEAKSNFLASTSHEIRTPMNAILGMVELILRSDIPREVYENALEIRQAGSNLLAIINDILDFSKIESGKLEIIPAPYNIASVINDCINIIRVRLEEKPLQFIVNAAARLPGRLSGDVVRIRQVILNLLSNAVKFTARGSISFHVLGEEGVNGAFTLSIRVADTGIGIRDEDRDRLFGEFVQLDSHRVRSADGTGLGLAISRRLCRAMGGDLTVESRYGQGSIFTAVIPQKIVDPAPIAKAVNARPVLVREHRSVYADSLESSLRSLRVPYHIAQSREEFAREIETGNYGWAFVAAEWAEEAAWLAGERKLPATVVLLADGVITGNSSREMPVITMPVWTLPVANILNGTVAEQHRESSGIRFTAPSARMLIVDDIATNLTVAARLLAPYRLHIDTSLSGSAAVAYTRENQYDLILMDHMMPEMDGMEAAALIREAEQNDGRPRTPIIAFTANAVSGMKEMFLDAGFDDFLSKPIEIPKLDEMVSRWIPDEKKLPPEQPLSGVYAPEPASTAAHDSENSLVIDGVDTARGIMMSGGGEAEYRTVLRVFCQDVRERLPRLTELARQTETLAGEALDFFVVQVHALKGAMATIGAMELSTLAARIEQAGRAKDLPLLTAESSGFTEHLAALAARIAAAIDSPAHTADSSDTPVDAGYRTIFGDLRAALLEEDPARVNSMLDTLSGMELPPALGAETAKIAHCVLLYEFQRAVSLIDALFPGFA